MEIRSFLFRTFADRLFISWICVDYFECARFSSGYVLVKANCLPSGNLTHIYIVLNLIMLKHMVYLRYVPKGWVKVNSTKEILRPCSGSLVGWSVILIGQGCEFDLQSEHKQESANKCMTKWNNRLMFLSPFLSLFKSN